jgi:signal transduction histidine kinase
LKIALESKFALSPLVLCIISIPGIIAVPLTEAHGSIDQLAFLSVVSLVTVFIGVLIFLGFGPLYKNGRGKWWLTILVAIFAGTIKGLSTWLLIDSAGYEQPSTVSRIVFAGISWGLVFPTATILAFSVLEARDRNKNLKNEISSASLKQSNLDQQLEWLIQTRIAGLNSELASKFVKLVSKLNSEGLGPRAYQVLAQELRDAAKAQVRLRSIKAWNRSQKRPLTEVVRMTMSAPANAYVALVVYGSGALANTLRVDGFGLGLAAVFATVVIFWGLAKFSFSSNLAQHLAPVILGMAISIVLIFFQFPISEVVPAAIATWIWAEVSIVAGITWTVVLQNIKQNQKELENSVELTEAEITWLSTRLESANIQVAQYLHSILQTRLMAYAMRIEATGSITEEEQAELQLLLTKPFVEFGRQYSSLTEGVDQLANAWATLAKIDIEITADVHSAVDITLQILHEAVANALRHGKATLVSIKITDSVNHRIIQVIDNGVGPKGDHAGLGTSIFDSLTKKHQLTENISGGANFVAELDLLPISP